MSFVSITFLIFYLVVLTLRFSVGRDKRSAWYLYGLLVLGLLFYGWHVPAYLLLLLNCIVSNFVAAMILQSLNANSRYLRNLTLLLVLAINLGLLAYFKYRGFLSELYLDLAGSPAREGSISAVEVLLPVGISFYTFQALSYTIDVYRGQETAQNRPGRFALYVSFFPQLVAGPIVRASQFFYQWSRTRRVRLRVFSWGTYLILRGLFFKVVVADNLGQVVDKYWRLASATDAPETLAFSLLVFYSCQLLCDFMAYTDIARGVAYQLGFRLPVNFNAPYIAGSFSDFWHRWHITLSRWMRDYVYLPLGGNRGGRWRTCRNLVVVMLVSGLWHGAGLNFIAWGAVHAVAIVTERATGVTRLLGRAGLQGNWWPASLIATLSWYLVVQLTWIFSMAFFRSVDIENAWQILGNAVQGLFLIAEHGVEFDRSKGVITAAWWFTMPVVALHFRTFVAERFRIRSSVYERSIYAGAMIYAVISLYAPDQRFIYFQF